jgi:hypothetical protein
MEDLRLLLRLLQQLRLLHQHLLLIMVAMTVIRLLRRQRLLQLTKRTTDYYHYHLHLQIFFF